MQKTAQGEFRGDVTRDTFDPGKHFSRVLMQQGRPLIDADWNEQTSILLHYLQTLARDLIGPHGGPNDGVGFRLPINLADLSADEQAQLSEDEKQRLNDGDFFIGAGRYYIDGILCENDAQTFYSMQGVGGKKLIEVSKENPNFLIYLDAWEEHISADQDESIREVALGEADTATRAKVFWQAKALNLSGDEFGTLSRPLTGTPEAQAQQREEKEALAQTVIRNSLSAATHGSLRARARRDEKKDEPCNISPESSYRGAENQLYRVEIHRGGKTGDPDQPTFKWARDNSSIAFPILHSSEDRVVLAHLGKDSMRTIKVDNWVEIVDDDAAMLGVVRPLFQIKSVDPVDQSITLKTNGASLPRYDEQSTKHPLLRRWDHFAGDPTLGGLELKEGVALIKESAIKKAATDPEEIWLKLEDGIEVQFVVSSDNAKPRQYRAGDYWIIPARVATGDIEWPGPVSDPAELPPHGVSHHYAPLAVVSVDKNLVLGKADLRRKFLPLQPAP